METSLKLDSCLGFDDGFLYMLQRYYEIDQYKKAQLSSAVTGITDIRQILFLDTYFDKIDWRKIRNFVISMVIERGNRKEQEEIVRFYGIKFSYMVGGLAHIPNKQKCHILIAFYTFRELFYEHLPPFPFMKS